MLHLYGAFSVKADFRCCAPMIWAGCKPSPIGHHEPGGVGAATGSGTTKRSEVSSPLGASIAPQTCIRSIREDRNHDAVMRIGGEAPRQRAHSKPRLKDHVQGRVAATSVRHLQLATNRRVSCRIFSRSLPAGKPSRCWAKEQTCPHLPGGHQAPKRNEELSG
jgi:hypothetical protein